MVEPKKCSCGLTKNSSGNCDGSHASIKKTEKQIPHNQITIRCLSTKGERQRTKFLFPHIASNKQLMRTMEFVVSDPNYDKKMECFKSKKAYSENGQSSEPVRESFATPVEKKEEVKVQQPKNEINSPSIPSEPKEKRKRRTKAEMLEAKQQSKLQKA